MPASDTPNYRTPSPDAGHEAIRAPLADAIDQLTQVVADLDQAQVGVDDAYLLTDLLFTLVDSVLTSHQDTATLMDAHRIRIDGLHVRADTAIDGMDALQTAVADIAARVATLEGHHVTLPGPDHAG